jgi:hypothetical protein
LDGTKQLPGYRKIPYSSFGRETSISINGYPTTMIKQDSRVYLTHPSHSRIRLKQEQRTFIYFIAIKLSNHYVKCAILEDVTNANASPVRGLSLQLFNQSFTCQANAILWPMMCTCGYIPRIDYIYKWGTVLKNHSYHYFTCCPPDLPLDMSTSVAIAQIRRRSSMLIIM